MSVAKAMDDLKSAMREDPGYAWAWHCNLAMPISDSIGATHENANVAAAYLMALLFDCDITTHPHYEYEKGLAQQYHEMRLAADRAEDAA